MFLLASLSACNQSTPIDNNPTDKDSIASATIKDSGQHQDQIKPSMDSIHAYYSENEVTSGRSNLPTLLEGCYVQRSARYGFYNFIDEKSSLKPPVVATALVSYNKNDWNYSDKSQELLQVIVKDKLFKYKPFSFAVGDTLNNGVNMANNLGTLEDIHYYQIEPCMVAIKATDKIIEKYVYWNCSANTVAIRELHQEVKKILSY